MLNEKHDPMATYGGSALRLEADTTVTATNNVLALGDRYGVDNASQSRGVVFNENLVTGNLVDDYLEFDASMSVEDLEDESELLDGPEANAGETFTLPVSASWAAVYASRNVIDRQVAEGDVTVAPSRVGALRRMLGLSVEGTALDADSDVWLPHLNLEEALTVGRTPIHGRFGCKQPPPERRGN